MALSEIDYVGELLSTFHIFHNCIHVEICITSITFRCRRQAVLAFMYVIRVTLPY